MLPIKGFSGRYRFLSNFWIEPDGSHVEGEFQRAKCAEAHQRGAFHTDGQVLGGPLKPPAQCKAIGRKVKLRADWETVKMDIMLFYVSKKFTDHRDLELQLLGTEDAYLEETNTWGDCFWGVCGGKGDNVLGFILMDVREKLWRGELGEVTV